MAILYVTEFRDQIRVEAGTSGIAKAPPVTEQTIAVSTAAQSTAAFNAATRLIRVHTDAICSIKIGTTVTATSVSARMVAGATEYFGVTPGDQLSCVSNS
jgi:hypothetical protein